MEAITDHWGTQLIKISPDFEYGSDNGVHFYLRTDLRSRLKAFLAAFENFRSKRNEKFLEPSLYPKLPYISENPQIWKNRQADLVYINQNFELKDKQILEVGSWNGWLTHQLSKSKARVCAIDYFTDPFDGLGTRSHYPNADWTSIQMDNEELSVFEPVFDLIIFNWNTMTLSEPLRVVKDAVTQLKAGGHVLLLGMVVPKKPEQRSQSLRAMANQFEKEYGTPYCLGKFKGYFENHDLEDFRNIGFQLGQYGDSLTRLRTWLNPNASMVYRGFYQKS